MSFLQEMLDIIGGNLEIYAGPHLIISLIQMEHEGSRTFITRGAADVMAVVGVKEEFVASYAKEIITVYVTYLLL